MNYKLQPQIPVELIYSLWYERFGGGDMLGLVKGRRQDIEQLICI